MAVTCLGVARGGVLDFPPNLIEQMGSFPQIAPISGMASILNPSPRSYMSYLDEQLYQSQLDGPVLIVGMQIRLAMGSNWRLQTPETYTANTWPNVDVQMAEFRVTMGRATPTIAEAGWFRTPNGIWLRGQFDLYYQDTVEVRSGPLTIPANSFVASGGNTGSHAWGPTFTFDTPYVYTPGETLVYRVSHQGIANADEVVPALFSSRYGARNFTDGMVALSDLAQAPSGLADVHYVRWITAPIPEPTTLGLLVPVFPLLSRRR
ncbi:MAG: hypothetical protein ACK4PI_11450 [Tepidisphaerales bacterium]